MAVLEVRLYGDPVLRRRAAPVREVTPEIEGWLSDMIDTMHSEIGIGLAAGATVLGPATLAGGRVQVVLLGGRELPATVTSVLEPLRGRRRLGGARLTVDIDPVELP